MTVDSELPERRVMMRVSAGRDARFSQDFDCESVVGQPVPLLVDGQRVGEGRVAAASVTPEGLLEIALVDVPMIWQQLYDEGGAEVSIAGEP